MSSEKDVDRAPVHAVVRETGETIVPVRVDCIYCGGNGWGYSALTAPCWACMGGTPNHDELKDYGSNSGIKCDMDEGPCACGAWH